VRGLRPGEAPRDEPRRARPGIRCAGDGP
jgi:hypothetical protein